MKKSSTAKTQYARVHTFVRTQVQGPNTMCAQRIIDFLLGCKHFAEASVSTHGHCLSCRDPDAALYGTDKTGKKAVVLLTIGEPVMKGDKVTFAAYHLRSTATPLLKGGIVDGLIEGQRTVRCR